MGVFIAGCANATEIRSPYLSERGPLRYKFERGNPDKYSLDVYSIGFGRLAHKAFLSHGTDTKPLTALMFNKSDFPVREIFPNNEMPKMAQEYNPFIALAEIHPRASYYEWGATLGARFEYPVYKNIGRIGLRANIPFKTVEIERENILDKDKKPMPDFVLGMPTNVARASQVGNPVNQTKYDEPTPVFAKLYKFELLKQITQGAARDDAVVLGINKVVVLGQDIASDFHSNNQHFRTEVKPKAGLVFNADKKNYPTDSNFSNWGYKSGPAQAFNVVGNDIVDVPANGDGGYGVRAGAAAIVAAAGVAATPASIVIGQRFGWAFDAGDMVVLDDNGVANVKTHAIAAGGGKPAMNTLVQVPNIAFFDNGTDYSQLNDIKELRKTALNDAWLAFGYKDGQMVDEARAINDYLDAYLEYYDESPEHWLYRVGGYEFETSSRTGLGDIDLDLFYEHMFSDRWIGELMLGLRFPTGLSDDYSQNPYKAHLGNGEHFELKFGGLIAWEPLGWMNLKLDLKGAYAFESSEKRCAAFEGATIKNIGPAVDADVSWWSFTGCFDINLFHPKTKDISADIGYEFYFKGEDDLHFKTSKMLPFYGQHYLGKDQGDLTKPLSNGLAEEHTESISHKVRAEVRIQINTWFEAFAGGAFTFAGQNIARETDCHGGCNVRF